jgi:hypothetical protein
MQTRNNAYGNELYVLECNFLLSFVSAARAKLPAEETLGTKGICRLVKHSMRRLRELP